MRLRISIFYLLSFYYILIAQHANDSLLFTIKLNDDHKSLFSCQWDDQVRSTLAGPVLMAGRTLLFYSQNGYALYNEKGKLLDAHSLVDDIHKAQKKGDKPIFLAYPIDSSTLLYYREASDPKEPTEVYSKNLLKKGLRRIPTDQYKIGESIGKAQLFNLANNSITDEMGRRAYLMPQLVGYTSLGDGLKFWSLEKFYSFSSPLIIEDRGKYLSFFPGLKIEPNSGIKKHLVEPIGAFQKNGVWYYYGLQSSMGTKDYEYYQSLILSDQAGTVLYTDQFLKEEMTDAVLQKVSATNTIYTVRRANRHVFVPAVDPEGEIYYGMIEFEWKRISVYKRLFYTFKNSPCDSSLSELLTQEGLYSFKPCKLDYKKFGLYETYPTIIKGSSRGMELVPLNEQIKEGFFIKIHRKPDEELKKRLNREQQAIPSNVDKMRDSISQIETAWCPYAISLNHTENGLLHTLYYDVGERVLASRVLAVTSTFEVYVRVDLENRAEIIVYSTDGRYLNRFIFNKEDFRDRTDVIAISQDRKIIEADYENDKNLRYLQWSLVLANDRPVIAPVKKKK